MYFFFNVLQSKLIDQYEYRVPMYILEYNEEYRELNTICLRSLVTSNKGISLISNITPSHKNMQIFSEQNLERLGQDQKEI